MMNVKPLISVKPVSRSDVPDFALSCGVCSTKISVYDPSVASSNLGDSIRFEAFCPKCHAFLTASLKGFPSPSAARESSLAL